MAERTMTKGERDACHVGMMNAAQGWQVVRLVRERSRQVIPKSSDSAFVGRTKRTSKWQGSPTPEGTPPWEIAA